MLLPEGEFTTLVELNPENAGTRVHYHMDYTYPGGGRWPVRGGAGDGARRRAVRYGARHHHWFSAIPLTNPDKGSDRWVVENEMMALTTLKVNRLVRLLLK